MKDCIGILELWALIDAIMKSTYLVATFSLYVNDRFWNIDYRPVYHLLMSYKIIVVNSFSEKETDLYWDWFINDASPKVY